MKDEPIGGLLASREVIAEYRQPMTTLEQSIYATAYGARMERWLNSSSRIFIAEHASPEHAEDLGVVDARHASSAAADARLAVELHRATND